MISSSINSRFLGNMIFTKEEALFLSKIRIIKKNLVHVHGFPSSLANIEILGKPEYFGQYVTIQKTILTQKTNPETNKKSFCKWEVRTHHAPTLLADHYIAICQS